MSFTDLESYPIYSILMVCLPGGRFNLNLPSESVTVVLSPLVWLASFIKAPLRGTLLSESVTMPVRREENV